MKKKISAITIFIVLLLAALSFLYPFYWMIVASLTPEAQIGTFAMWPESFTLDNYAQMAGKIPIWRSMINSTMVASTYYCRSHCIRCHDRIRIGKAKF